MSEHVEQWKILLGNTWGPAVSKMVSQVAAIYTCGHVGWERSEVGHSGFVESPEGNDWQAGLGPVAIMLQNIQHCIISLCTLPLLTGMTGREG